MTCSTCKREDVPDTCGCAKTGDTCECCGITVIATASEQEIPDQEDEGR